MVYQKRLEHGSSSFQVPAMPKVPPSAKGKRSARKKLDHKQMSAFDMLATVAGKSLLVRERYPIPEDVAIGLDSCAQKEIAEHEKPIEGNPLKVFEIPVSGNFHSSRFGSELIFQTHLTGLQNARAIKPHGSWRSTFAGQLTSSANKDELTCGGGSIRRDDFTCHKIQLKKPKAICTADACAPSFSSLEGTLEVAARPSTFVNSDCSMELALCRNHTPPKSSFPKSGGSMELGLDKDDDDNFSGCKRHSTHSYRVRTQHMDRQIRKLLKFKSQKSPPTVFSDAGLANMYGERKTHFSFSRRRISYKYHRLHRSLFKRKKMFEQYLLSNSHRKVVAGAESSVSSANKANGALSFTDDPKAAYDSGDFHVRLRIKSFKVPEIFIEMPENATIGSLKRTVMEAANAILGGGLRVGIVLQGKKVRDDSKTLRQAGISDIKKLDNLGFTLEPKSTQAPQRLTAPDHLNLLTSDTPEVPISHQVTVNDPVATTSKHLLNCALDSSESGDGSIQSSTNTPSQEKRKENLKALVPVLATTTDALVVPPLKPKRPELVQRRTRRPFSVNEVEALVRAVEMLGTGRWRDVKVQAFDNANHRTYVDLKDKWKTLVHTARIAPQQRRGEPVPQELLDQVLRAHAYWSQQQMKLQSKPVEA